MNKAKFRAFLKDPVNRKALAIRGIVLSRFPRVTSDIYIARHSNDQPLCIFEVTKKMPSSVCSSKKTLTDKNSLLQRMPSFCLNIPGYHISYSADEEGGPITGFHVKKVTPKERFVGDLTPREFIKFVAATVTFCRKEKSNDRT